MSTRTSTLRPPHELAERTAFREIYIDRDFQAARWHRLFDRFQSLFGRSDARFFSSPGRVELCGNHTDHNGGLVLAAAVNLDTIAAAAPNDTQIVTIHAEGYDLPFIVDLAVLDPQPNEVASSSALIRGIASRLDELGFAIGGFDACITSDVLVGSGLSSSASVEILIGAIFNALYNDSKIDLVTLAKVGQYAENNFFGKPCGLMDQIACAVGGVMMIDFRDASSPHVEQINGAFGDAGHALVIVNTGGSHADLTEDYAAIPREMNSVAEAFAKRRLIEVSRSELLSELPRVRRTAGDRAILRALHFLNENERVLQQVDALKNKDLAAFLQLANQSGDSSWQLLQNCYSPNEAREQGVALALSLTKEFLRESKPGACRVQGGGFAGTIQAWMPSDAVNDYRNVIEPVLGKHCIVTPAIRSRGACEI